MTKRILIVDDEYDIRAVVQLTLKAVGGWDVASAASGQEGLEKAVGQSPDVILLDVMMPEMDGISTFKILQAHPETEQIPVIFLTAKAQAAERRQFNDLGVSGVITKPFNSLDLPEQIAKILHWPLEV